MSTTHLVIGTAGHIDHGKSALVQALTGVDPDRLKDEQLRGITIDLGFAHYRDDGLNVAFVDVPGHERFVRNMLAGASGIDSVLLVIAADESVMPQTREHFDICRLLEVKTGVVALTKTDLVDDETVELVRLETRELVIGSFLETAPIVPVSARTGQGLDELRGAIRQIAAEQRAPAAANGTRLPIDRAFTMRGFGTVVTGTLVSGTIGVDVALELLPAGRPVRVRGLQVHGQPQPTASAGQRVAVNVAGVEVGELRRGDTLVAPGLVGATRRFDAVLTLLPTARPLKHGARVRCHQGTAEVMARVSLAGEPVTTAAGEAPPVFPAVLDPGHTAFARLRLEQPTALTRGDRFVLRAYSPPVTIAGGQVLDPAPPRGRLRSRAGLDRLHRLSDLEDPVVGVAAMVEDAGARGLPLADVVCRAGVAPTHVDAVVAAVVQSGRATARAGRLLAPARLKAIGTALMDAVATFHQDHPLEAGLPRGATREQYGRQTTPEVFDAVVEQLVASGELVATDRLALPDHRIALTRDEEQVRDRLDQLFRRAGLTPPEPTAAAATLGVADVVVERMLTLLLREERLVRIEGLVFHREALDALKLAVVALKTGHAEPVRLDVGQFKERFDVTRKYAIPLLGYLDRERVTRRVGQARVVL